MYRTEPVKINVLLILLIISSPGMEHTSLRTGIQMGEQLGSMDTLILREFSGRLPMEQKLVEGLNKRLLELSSHLQLLLVILSMS